MVEIASSASQPKRMGEAAPSRLPVFALGMSVSSFFLISYVLCVLFHVLFPSPEINQMWIAIFPGFTWLTWQSFFLGLIESFVLGWYIAVVFGPLYNFFVARAR